MKRILLFVCLIVSFQVFGQGDKIPTMYRDYMRFMDFTPPTNYQYRYVRERSLAAMFDSGLHIPSYNGAPSGTRTNIWPHDGAIAMDTTNNKLYIYSGGGWIDVTGGASSKFGHASGDYSAAENRNFNLHGTYSMTFDSVNSFSVNRGSVTGRLYANASSSGLFSPDGLNSLQTSNAVVQLNFNSGANYFWGLNDSLIAHKRISYEGNIHSTFFPYSLVDKSYVDSAITGITDTHIGNTNLTLSADRTLAMAGNSLTFSSSGLKQFFIEPDSRYQLGAINDEVGAAMGLDIDNVTNTVKLGSLSAFTGLSMAASGTRFIKFDIAGTNYFHINGSGEIFLTGGLPSGSASDSVVLIDPSTKQLKMRNAASLGGSGGTVTSVAAGFGTNFTTITTTGSVVADTTSGGVTSWVRTKKIIDSLQAAGWGDNIYSEPWYASVDELRQSDRGQHYYGSSGTGSATTFINSVSTATFAGWIGRLDLITGTTTTGFANGFFGHGGLLSPVVLDNSFRTNVGAKIRLEDLSDGTDTYFVLTGMTDNSSAIASINDAVCFRYTNADSSGQWICRTESNDNITEVASGVTVAADTDYTLEISVFNGEAKFYIKTGTGAKTLVATISTNIPTGTSRITGISHSIVKTAGTTTRTMYCDWFAYGTRSN